MFEKDCIEQGFPLKADEIFAYAPDGQADMPPERTIGRYRIAVYWPKSCPNFPSAVTFPDSG